MPLYAYRCKDCDCTKVEMRTIAEREDAPECDRCREKMELEIAPVVGIVKNPAVLRNGRMRA